MPIARFLVPGLVGAALCGCSSAPVAPDSPPPAKSTTSSAAFQPSVYYLNVGDRLHINVFQEDDLSGEFTVDSDGKINYPLLGRIQVARQTTSQVEAQITRGLSNGYLVKPDVRATIIGYTPIFVGGSVKSPGEYPFKPGLTVHQAITLAGGLTRFAAEKYYVQRAGTGPDDQFRATPDVQVFPGDTIVVHERLF